MLRIILRRDNEDRTSGTVSPKNIIDGKKSIQLYWQSLQELGHLQDSYFELLPYAFLKWLMNRLIVMKQSNSKLHVKDRHIIISYIIPLERKI